MRAKYALAIAALLAASSAHAGVIVSSIDGSTLSPSFQGAAPGSTYITFADVAAGTSGTFTSGGFAFHGDGAVEVGSVAGAYATPAGDTTTYLSTGFTGERGSKTETVFFGDHTKFGLYWGSIDAYNTISFLKGGSTVFSLTGTGVPAATANGNQTSDISNKYVNFNFTGGSSYDTVVFNSTTPAFEVDNLAVAGGVPELSTWAMMIVGFGLVGLQVRRRNSFAANPAA